MKYKATCARVSFGCYTGTSLRISRYGDFRPECCITDKIKVEEGETSKKEYAHIGYITSSTLMGTLSSPLHQAIADRIDAGCLSYMTCNSHYLVRTHAFSSSFFCERWALSARTADEPAQGRNLTALILQKKLRGFCDHHHDKGATKAQNHLDFHNLHPTTA